MKKTVLLLSAISLTIALSGQTTGTRNLPYKMEDLTSPQFVRAIEKAGGVCVIPLGIIEKHGPHLPLGTDLYEARETAFKAAEQEYAVVFPPYFTGQILEARHQPGAIAYSTDLMWKMLEETCMELSRNGLKKIILMNGHGGNTNFLQYFCQAQLEGQKDFVVVLFQPDPDSETQKAIRAIKKTTLDGHAGEDETSMMYYINPALVDVQAAGTQSGADQKRLNIPYGYTGIWWYARFPNHYAGDGTFFSKELGELLLKSDASQLAVLIKFLKTDNSIKDLQDEFGKRAANPAQK
jgi:creatinine amidohydrolase